MLHGVPGLLVGTADFGGQVLLWPAGAAVVAVLGAGGALAGDALVAREARALAGFAVAETLV